MAVLLVNKFDQGLEGKCAVLKVGFARVWLSLNRVCYIFWWCAKSEKYSLILYIRFPKFQKTKLKTGFHFVSRLFTFPKVNKQEFCLTEISSFWWEFVMTKCSLTFFSCLLIFYVVVISTSSQQFVYFSKR